MPRKKKPVIEYRHYSLPIQFPVLLLSGDRWRISDIKSEHLHFHNHLEIGICYSDSGIMEIKGEAVPFKAGDITFLPRFLPHTTYSSKDSASLWSYLFFSPEELFQHSFKSAYSSFEPNLWRVQGRNCVLSRELHPKVYYLATSIVEELKQQRPYYQESAYGLLQSLYIELLRIYSANELLAGQESEQALKGDFVISPALEYITKHYMTPITIDFLAELCHLSTTHFRRKFHEIMGTAPLDFLTSTRIEEACKQLKSTDDSILSISEQVGFHSISSFNRCFSRLMGTSPKEWRKGAQSEAQSAKASILEFTGWV
ncbi:AraC family transcriptional regulator [Paenibacillus sp. FSL R7-0273]|uniref:AraC family transcriptional regulator n=1 Tax=Paenibacillus sp. FSL R7-0273 TaxID=1536772 RepID=UPI0004F8F390|nr:AraC family transcriptional regulator [Paenibacillus sp. FSL R7-0273]AIQ45057.1 AraC family transcriptional regulator [Paenibacillus sp. FSL R7-0273]OMF84098.1 AraC family transcriptional regulator [Paenibacillus sp. FSL R7-0273]